MSDLDQRFCTYRLASGGGYQLNTDMHPGDAELYYMYLFLIQSKVVEFKHNIIIRW